MNRGEAIEAAANRAIAVLSGVDIDEFSLVGASLVLGAVNDLRKALALPDDEAQWVKIEPGCKMPADDEDIIVVLSRGVVCPAYYAHETWFVNDTPIDTSLVKRWRPMPAAPKEDGDA
jgi:hypothetical protein